MGEEIFVKNQETNLEKKQLFLIAVGLGSIPFLMRGRLILIYSEKEKAELCAKRFEQIYIDGEIKVNLIPDNKVFFAKMTACGLNKFLLDGDGEILDFSDFCDVELVKSIKRADEVLTKINNAQPLKRIELTPPLITFESIAEALRVLPVIHKNRLITAYVCGIISLIISIVMTIYRNSASTLIFILVCSILIGLSNASKVSGKLKEKNRKVANLARFSMIFYIISAIIIIGILNSNN